MNALAAARLRSLRDWLFRLRGSEPEPIRLTIRRIYLMPTGAGIAFGFALLTMMLSSINYALSLGLVLTFLLGGIALAGAMSGFRNLLGVAITRSRTQPVFCGEGARFGINLHNHRTKPREALELVTEDGRTAIALLPAQDSTTLALVLPTARRGWQNLPWVKVQTRFPMGLVNVWAYVRPAMKVLVYPALEANPPPLPMASGTLGQHTSSGAGAEDFDGLRAYRETDSPRHIAWKIAAREGPLLVKQFTGQAGGKVTLDWHALGGRLGTEQKLSRLATWVKQAHERGLSWKLVLPAAELGPASGVAHYHACLERLALHEHEAR